MARLYFQARLDRKIFKPVPFDPRGNDPIRDRIDHETVTRIPINEPFYQFERFMKFVRVFSPRSHGISHELN